MRGSSPRMTTPRTRAMSGAESQPIYTGFTRPRRCCLPLDAAIRYYLPDTGQEQDGDVGDDSSELRAFGVSWHGGAARRPLSCQGGGREFESRLPLSRNPGLTPGFCRFGGRGGVVGSASEDHLRGIYTIRRPRRALCGRLAGRRLARTTSVPSRVDEVRGQFRRCRRRSR